MLLIFVLNYLFIGIAFGIKECMKLDVDECILRLGEFDEVDREVIHNMHTTFDYKVVRIGCMCIGFAYSFACWPKILWKRFIHRVLDLLTRINNKQDFDA